MSRTQTIAVDYRPTDALIPYARNPRTHSEDQVAQIAGSIKEFGFTNPVLIDETGGIIAGHGRVMAARKLSLEQVPCVVLAGLTEAQKRAYVLADNKLALNAGWDWELVGIELQDLAEVGYDLALTGFSDKELKDLMGETGPSNSEPVVDQKKYLLMIEYPNEQELQDAFDQFTLEGRSCKILE